MNWCKKNIIKAVLSLLTIIVLFYIFIGLLVIILQWDVSIEGLDNATLLFILFSFAAVLLLEGMCIYLSKNKKLIGLINLIILMILYFTMIELPEYKIVDAYWLCTDINCDPQQLLAR